MSPQILLGLASVLGAGLFLAAGLLLGRRSGGDSASSATDRAAEQAAAASAAAALAAANQQASAQAGRLVETERELGVLRTDSASHKAELAARHTELVARHAELAARQAEVLHHRTDNERLSAELQRQQAEAGRQAAVLAANRAEGARHEQEALAARAAERTRIEEARAEVDRRTDQLRVLQESLSELKLERTRWLEQQDQLERRVAAIDPEVEKTLRHDLAVERERLAGQAEKIQRLGQDNLSMRSELDSLTAQLSKLEALEREIGQLRVRALAHDLLPATPSNVITGTQPLDVLVANVGRLDAVRSAVIGDDLGLVVSCQGNHSDELAAIGALFNRACSEALKVLPLGRIQLVSLQDESNVSITVRPLRSETEASEDHLTLVTLGHGAEPDAASVTRILQDAAGGHDTAGAPGISPT